MAYSCEGANEPHGYKILGIFLTSFYALLASQEGPCSMAIVIPCL
jgi:hypothetical protein